MLKKKSPGWLTPAIIATSVGICIIDSTTEKGIGDYIFYFVPVALTFLHVSPRFPALIAAFCTALTTLGFYLSPMSDADPTISITNRTIGVISVWALAFLVRQIITSRNKVEENTWIKEGASELAIQVRGELKTTEVVHQILDCLSARVNFDVGAIYLKKDKEKHFHFVAGHAYKPDQNKMTILPGEGLLGQTAVDKEVKMISPLAKEHMKISSALGESATTHLILVPMVVDDETVALMELGFLHEPSHLICDFMKEIAELCGTAIRSADYKATLAELLHQSRRQTQQLQSQQEELKVINEELEQQTKAIKESHLRLENQQAELEQTNSQLEEQTQELENQKNLLDEKNRQLENKNDEIKRSSNYKSEFLANMSHELRTPLNSTLILAKLLADNKQGNLTKEQIEYADIIYNSGNDLLNLINDILDLSKVEAGKMTVNPEVIFIEQVTKNLEQTFKPLALEKNLDLKLEVDQNVPHDMITDRQRLEQILKNFLSNAFKFTPAGGITLQVYMDHGRISFAVSDTGVGMSSEEQAIVFEAFRQADGTTNRKYGGTGLGLSISKELAHLLGGEINLRSTKGQGSTFTLTLPVTYNAEKGVVKQPLPQAPAPRPASAPAQGEEEKTNHKRHSFKDDRENIENFSRRILLIEDDESFAKVLYDLAHEMKFGAIVASTGEEGIELAGIHQPHAIALDINLPDHSGMIVLDQLKMNAKTRHIPVHIISSEDFARSALEMGAIGYMMKPVKKEQLSVAFQNITSMLEQKVKHVLILEDDPVQRMHISQLIGVENVEVTAVATSAEALNQLSKKTFDCMIMDLSLPDMSGYELLSKLSNESSTYSFPPVIVYTARDLTAAEEQKLRLYSGSIIIKGAKSPERLLSEVTLFLHKVETELPPERQKMLMDLRSREKNLQDKTILVVDDDIRNIFALTAALEAHGAKIESARNGLEALVKINRDVDLVLMDIMMPEMDGYEAMRKIRENKEVEHIPIIALTAKAMKDDKEKCLEAGADDYLSKPIDMDKLLSLIRVWLPQKRRFS